MVFRYFKRILAYLFLVIILLPVISCGAAKDVEERRNLMMPRIDEIPRNKKFNQKRKKRKAYKIKKNQKRVKRRKLNQL